MDALLLKLVKLYRGTLSLKEAAIVSLHLFVLFQIFKFGFRYIKSESLISPDGLGVIALLIVLAFFVAANIFVGIGLWKCAKNVAHEWRFWKYVARLYAAFLVFTSSFAILSLVVGF